MQKRLLAIFCILISFCLSRIVLADTIILKTGQSVQGKIIEKTDKYIKMDVQGTSLTFYSDEIKDFNQDKNSNGDNDSLAVIKKAEALYRSLKTFKAHGTIIADVKNIKITTDFDIALKKPDQYLISWTQHVPMGTGGMTQSGAVWNDGTQPYLFMGMMNAYSKMNSDEIALGTAAGISGGASMTIPSIFFPVFKAKSSVLGRLINPKMEGMAMVGNDNCYVISGASAISKKETVWISQSKYLIRKYSRSLEAPPGGRKIPELTDDQIEKVIQKVGMEDTAENREKIKEEMKQAQNILTSPKLKGSFTETYDNISSPEITKEECKYPLPEGAVLKKSLI